MCGEIEGMRAIYLVKWQIFQNRLKAVNFARQ